MAERVELEIEISRTGAVTVQVRGVKGPGCADLARVLAEAVGAAVATTRTSEYYAPEPVYQKKRTT